MSFRTAVENLSPARYLPTDVAEPVQPVPTSTFEPLHPSSVGALLRVANTLRHAAYLAPQLRDSHGILGQPATQPFYCGTLKAERNLRMWVSEKTAEVAKRGPHIAVIDPNREEPQRLPIDYRDLARFEVYGARPSFITRTNVEQEPVKKERDFELPKQASTFEALRGAVWLAISKPSQTTLGWLIKNKLPKPRFGRAKSIGSVALSR